MHCMAGKYLLNFIYLSLVISNSYPYEEYPELYQDGADKSSGCSQQSQKITITIKQKIKFQLTHIKTKENVQKWQCL